MGITSKSIAATVQVDRLSKQQHGRRTKARRRRERRRERQGRFRKRLRRQRQRQRQRRKRKRKKGRRGQMGSLHQARKIGPERKDQVPRADLPLLHAYQGLPDY